MTFFVRPIIRPPANLYKNYGGGGGRGGGGRSKIRVSRNGPILINASTTVVRWGSTNVQRTVEEPLIS